MIYSYTNFLAAFLATVAFGVTLHYSKKNKESINYYFLIILLLLALQKSFAASKILFNVTIENKLSHSYIAIIFIPIPLFYLFTKESLKYKITLKENLAHFTIVFIVMLINIFIKINETLKVIHLFIFSTTYLFLIVQKPILYFKKEKKDLLKSKKIWLFLMLSIFILLYTTANIFLFRHTENKSIPIKEFYNITSIIWITCLTYLFIHPEIFFGVENLKSIIRKEEITFKSIWKLKPIKKIKAYDQKVHDKVASNAIDIINKIERYIDDYDFHSNLPLDFTSISEGININAYHLNYVLKYYCIFSKNDFFNYYKIMHVLALIEKGYLHNKSINSLISDSHFKSQKTFSNNFKKFTGKSPQEINKLLKFKM